MPICGISADILEFLWVRAREFRTSSTTLPGAGAQTLTDLVNRTYRIGFTYQSPYSP